MDQPVTIFGALVALLLAAGGIAGGVVTYRAIMGYVRGMPKC